MAITALREYYGELVPGAMADLQNDVRNECRAQIVPGYDSNLLAATMIIKAICACARAQSPRAAHGLHAHTACAIGGWS